MLNIQTQGPEFEPPNPHEKTSTVVGSYNPVLGRRHEEGGTLGLVGQTVTLAQSVSSKSTMESW